MATSEAGRPRAPRGTKILTQAFFAALDDIPEAQQEVVAKAALFAVKEQLQLRRQKARLLIARTRTDARLRATRTRKATAKA